MAWPVCGAQEAETCSIEIAGTAQLILWVDTRSLQHYGG